MEPTSDKRIDKRAMFQGFLVYPLLLGISASLIITLLRLFDPSSNSIIGIFIFAFAIGIGYIPLFGKRHFVSLFADQQGLITKILKNKEQKIAFALFVGFLVLVGILFHV